MKSLVMTLIGNDKTGLVDKLAKAVRQHGGNWQASRFAHMAGQFAGFVEVTVPQDNADALVESINAIPDLAIQMVNVKTPAPQTLNIAHFNILGNDKPGIVSEITAVLQQFNINILEFNSKCVSAPNWGNLMFQAEFVVALPDNVESEEIQTALETIANDLVVDITFEK
ncbi:ACT domain-containing protein [Alteromonas sp. ASW11-36]|uniref:Glycine cleavage system transcriptional repressor n=1 Tax=Alteromonas arenosi TaxID=3055817 RepID=A0ABT7T096_9ALTE|nr:ACT domain-containing protein [Alteromonas sp. ASW11-36]MDM7861864.1 ACT domain-containing protein [Alteromonas sp. ASW11-36]